MRTLTLVVSLFIVVSLSSQSYEWVKASTVTQENLHTAYIDNIGNMYIFGDNAFGAVSKDGGHSWEIIERIDPAESRSIKACGEYNEKIIVSGENGLIKRDQPIPYYLEEWNDFELYNEDVESIQVDNNGSVYFFPSYLGLGTRSNEIIVEENGKRHTYNSLYNFYLPFTSNHPRNPGFKYVSGVSGSGKMVSAIHHTATGMNGNIHQVAYFNGVNTWRTVSEQFSKISYVRSIRFQDEVGFLLGYHAGGYGILLYRSDDGGENWELIYEDSRGPVKITPLSLFNDCHEGNNNAMIVGLLEEEGNLSGFVKINDEESQVISQERLNYITGKDNKFIIVGNGGQVFIGERKVKSSMKTIFFPDDDVEIFDISGRNIKKISSDNLKNLNLNSGAYILKNNSGTKKIIVY